MSVLIKGMEMPKNCSECQLNYDMMSCGVTGTRWWSDTMTLMDFDCQESRLYDCPLVELPEKHGRLIDADALFLDIEWSDIEEAPTVIEAEGVEA